MPSVKIPKKSTDVDMTPFVDVAFLILTFFIMATKFKPPEVAEITIPNSVSTKLLPDNDAVMVSLDSTGRVFFEMLVQADPQLKYKVISNLNTTRNLNLTEAEMQRFMKKVPAVGVPFSGLKQYLSLSDDEMKRVKLEGIPTNDSLGGELYYWVRDAVSVMAGKKINYLIKGDNNAKYPAFKNVLAAFKKNDIYKFNLVTSPEGVPSGSDLDLFQKKQSTVKK
ncbi:MAG: biopolymer transporter ExbD [Terrimonas sp.]|nr:biopolymer transporter ExbD [Terrimonas sp.]